MIEFRTLGTVDLRRDGEELRAVVLQPKRLAVLAYLATASPRGFHSRDRVLGLFWPDLDQERARNAMRQALHFLRKSLGEEVVAGRGDREVGLGEGTLWCDAAAFDDALAAGRPEDAVALYRGDFLPGFFVEDAVEAERWLEAERERRRLAAREALRSLVEREEAKGERRAAVLWARRAVALAPADEGLVRQLMGALDRAGEPAAALDAYDQLVHRLREEFGVAASGETIALVKAIRGRPVGGGTVGERKDDGAADGLSAGPGTVTQQPAGGADAATGAGAPPAARDAATPSGVPPVRDAEVPPTAAPRRSARRVAIASLAAAVLAVLGGTLALRRTAAASEGAPTGSVAVLPFVNMSGDPANEYLADGFTEEILNVLANLDGLQVAARTSAFKFKGQEVTVDSVGRALRVRHVLEGSVRKDGDRLRVTAQLIDAATGYHVWSETYDRTVGDLFAVQDEISRAIAVKLRTGVATDTTSPDTRDAEAHAMFLRARAFSRRGSAYRDSMYARLDSALARDPDYARARGYLALSLAYDPTLRHTAPEATYARARREAERSLAAGETPEAHMALGYIATVRDWDFTRADDHMARAIALAPSQSGAYTQRARLLLRRGRAEEALAVARHAVALDPLNPAAHNALAGVFALTDRYAEAIESYRAALALVPNDVSFLSNMAAAQADAGDSTGALASLAAARATPHAIAYLDATEAYVAARIGRTAQARALIATLERDSTVQESVLASAYAALGDREGTLRALERAAATRDDLLADLMVVREFQPYHDDPRFVAIRRQLGL
jgi:TolB-like protein/DNA-binding SARP family transcriptional activator